MSNQGYHAADDGSLARSTGGAAARGAMLIALALIIGLLLMAFALDDPQTDLSTASGDTVEAADDDGGNAGDAGDGDSSDAAAGDTASEDASAGVTAVEPDLTEEATTDTDVAEEETTETIPPVEGGVARPPSEVLILVANGTGGAGVAGAVSDTLVARSYITSVSNAPSTAEAVIYYRVGFAEDARAVADILGAPVDIVTQAPGDGTIAVSAEAAADGRLLDANIIVIVGNDGNIPTG